VDKDFQAAVKELRDALRHDLLLESRHRQSGRRIELLIVPRGPIKVSMYQEQGGRHHRPHIHVQFADTCDGTFSIEPPQILAGDCRPRFARRVLTWIDARRSALLQAWDAVQEGEHPPKLEITLD